MHRKHSKAGFNFHGFFRAESGLGTAARGTVKALDAEGIPYALRDCRYASSRKRKEEVKMVHGRDCDFEQVRTAINLTDKHRMWNPIAVSCMTKQDFRKQQLQP